MVLMGGSICRVFVALLALSLFTYARAASQTSAPAGSPTAITIGVVADNAPYSNADGADITGFSIDIHKEITRNTGLHFDYRAGSWAQIYQAFLRGEIDAIDAISYREDRARSMLFTEPYHVRQTVIMHDIKKPIGQLTSLQDLHNKKIGILNDIYYKQVLADAGLGIVEYDAFSSLIQALAFGWVDAIVGPQLTLQFLASQAGFRQLKVRGQVAMEGLENEDFRLAVLNNKPQLHAVLNEGLEAIPDTRREELVTLWREYGGATIAASRAFRLSEPQQAYMRQLGPVRVGIMEDYAPYSFVDNGNLQGLSVDILRRIQDLTGLQVVTISDQWPTLLNLFRRGEIDVIANISQNSERTEFTRFTEPYHLIPNVVFSRNPDYRYQSLEDLAGLNMAVTKSVFYQEALIDRFGDAVLPFKDQQAMFQALDEGSVDVVITALLNGNYWIRKQGLTDVRVAGELSMPGFRGEDLRFGVRPSLEPLAHIMNLALMAISPTERRSIENRWLGSMTVNDSPNNPPEVQLTPFERSYLERRGQPLTLCVDPDWMPLEALDKQGRHTGMAADFFNLFRSRLDLDFQILKTASWSDSLEAVRQRRCDMLSMAMQTPQRSDYLNFSTPYYTVPGVILGRLETPFMQRVAELQDKKIGVVEGYALAELLATRYPKVHFVPVENEQQGLRMVQDKGLYGHISNLITAGHHIKDMGLADIKVIGRFPADWALAIASRNDEPELQGIAQKMVETLSGQDRKRIESHWQAFMPEQKLDYTLISQVGAAAVLLLGLLFFWNRKLGSLNHQLAQANNKLEQLSLTDELTQVGNRNFFEKELRLSMQWCLRQGTGFALAMIDADHFKSINDRYGHHAGDMCLKALADIMRSVFRRDIDHIARFGGEEFIIFTACNRQEDILERLETLRQEVAANPVFESGNNIHLTISIGVALLPPGSASDRDTLLKLADQALYRAKESGRNQIRFAWSDQV